jgi:aldose 1-epimerase
MDEVTISDGTVELVVLPEAGARIHRLRAFGHDVVRTPADPAVHLRDPFFWGAYVMAPWCNRVEAGPQRLGERTLDLAANFPDGSAIHGQVYLRPWERRRDGTFAVRGGEDGWPWAYETSLRVAVERGSVRLEQRLRNRSADPMPAGLGLHPWFLRPVEVAIRAGTVFRDNLATSPLPEPVAGPFDLRRVGAMADDLDAAWADVAEPAVELRWSDLGIRATMQVAAPNVYVVAASPSAVDAIAVEPETHAPQALRRLRNGEPGGLTMLEPGGVLELTTDLTFERLDAR